MQMNALGKDFTSLNSFKTRGFLLKILNFLKSIYQKQNEWKLFIHQFLKTIQKLGKVIAIHQSMMHVNGHRHRSFAIIGNHHFSKRNFWATIRKSITSGVRNRREIDPWNYRKMNQIIVWKFSGQKSSRVLYSLNFI